MVAEFLEKCYTASASSIRQWVQVVRTFHFICISFCLCFPAGHFNLLSHSGARETFFFYMNNPSPTPHPHPATDAKYIPLVWSGWCLPFSWFCSLPTVEMLLTFKWPYLWLYFGKIFARAQIGQLEQYQESSVRRESTVLILNGRVCPTTVCLMQLLWTHSCWEGTPQNQLRWSMLGWEFPQERSSRTQGCLFLSVHSPMQTSFQLWHAFLPFLVLSLLGIVPTGII